MVSKNNRQRRLQADAKQVPHYGLRKLGIGVVSVLLGTSFYLGNAAVSHADTVNSSSVVSENSQSNAAEQTCTKQRITSDNSNTSTQGDASLSLEKQNGGVLRHSYKPSQAKTSALTKSENEQTIPTLGASNKKLTRIAAVKKQSNQAEQTSTVNTSDIQNNDVRTLAASLKSNDELSEDTAATRINSQDKRFTLTFNGTNTVIGQTNSSNTTQKNLLLNLYATNTVKAGDKVVITIPGADTFKVTADALDAEYGYSTISNSSPDPTHPNGIWTLTYVFDHDVDATVKLGITITPTVNGYGAEPIQLHDPLGDTKKTITWTESVKNGTAKSQDNTGLTFISRQMPNWNPGQNVTDASGLNGKQFINSSQIIYTYSVNEDNGVSPSTDKNLSYPSQQVNSAVNYGTIITIPMPKGFVLDKEATNKLIPDNGAKDKVTIIQDADGNVIINVPKGQGSQGWQAQPAYKFVGHYENVTQEDTTFTLTGGYISIKQKLNDDGSLSRKFTATSPVTDTFYGKNDPVEITNVDRWVSGAWKNVWPGNYFLPYWSDQHDQIIAYAGFRNGFITGLTQPTIHFDIPDGMIVHGIRVPKGIGVDSYDYSYTLDDGTVHTGTVAAGEEITVADNNRTITSVDLKTATIPKDAGTQITTSTQINQAISTNTSNDQGQFISNQHDDFIEFYGHLGMTKRDGKTEIKNGEVLPLKMSISVAGTTELLQATANITAVPGNVSTMSSGLRGQTNITFSKDTDYSIHNDTSASNVNNKTIFHIGPFYTNFVQAQATTFYIQSPTIYVVLPKGITYLGLNNGNNSNANSKHAKVSLTKDEHDNTIVKLDFPNYQYDIRQGVDLQLGYTHDVAPGSKYIQSFFFTRRQQHYQILGIYRIQTGIMAMQIML